MYYTYILYNKQINTYYVGYSSNLKERMLDHKQKQVTTTENGGYILVWYSAFTSKIKALSFEKYLKSSSGHAFRKKHLLN